MKRQLHCAVQYLDAKHNETTTSMFAGRDRCLINCRAQSKRSQLPTSLNGALDTKKTLWLVLVTHKRKPHFATKRRAAFFVKWLKRAKDTDCSEARKHLRPKLDPAQYWSPSILVSTSYAVIGRFFCSQAVSRILAVQIRDRNTNKRWELARSPTCSWYPISCYTRHYPSPQERKPFQAKGETSWRWPWNLHHARNKKLVKTNTKQTPPTTL